MASSPNFVVKRTPVMPGPRLTLRANGTPSAVSSQVASSSALALLRAAATSPPMIWSKGWSSAAANKVRQGVMRVQVKSVSPGTCPLTRVFSAAVGLLPAAASVTRRWPSRPSWSSDGRGGPTPGHHTSTGASGNSIGSTTESAWSRSGP